MDGGRRWWLHPALPPAAFPVQSPGRASVPPPGSISKYLSIPDRLTGICRRVGWDPSVLIEEGSVGTLQGCPGGPGSCCAPVHLLLSIELPSSDITSFPGPWINGPGPKAATHTAVAVLLGGSADSGRAQRFVRDTGSPVLSVTGLPAPRHAEKAVPAQGRRSPLPPRHWARTDPPGDVAFLSERQ